MLGIQDASTALSVTTRIAAIGVAVSSLEMLARPAAVRERGMLSWCVARLRTPVLAVGRVADARAELPYVERIHSGLNDN